VGCNIGLKRSPRPLDTDYPHLQRHQESQDEASLQYHLQHALPKVSPPCDASRAKSQLSEPLPKAYYKRSPLKNHDDLVQVRMSASVGLAWRLTKLSPDREGMQIDKNVVDQLIQSTNADIRQVLNMLSTWRLSKKTMDFDEGKQL
jgi:hypothetical protein